MTSLDTHLDINALMEMGFPKERVEQALKATNNRGIPDALEWLFSHPVVNEDSGQCLGGGDDSSNTEKKTDSPSKNNMPTENTEDAGQSSSAVAMSLKCEECGKLLKSEGEATMHASRSGHSQFAESTEEIKPLTEEEKIAQRQRLTEKMEERRKQRQVDEKEQEKLREKNRRRTGQEITKAKDEHAYNEMKKLADERRNEKMEEKRLKQQLKEQIARDRANFKAKNQSQQSTSPTVSKPTALQQPVASNTPKKDYNTCRVQFRMSDGSTHNSNFKADDTLFTVHDYISKNRTDGCAETDLFTLSTTFPRKTFNNEHMLKTLKELGLVPSVVLILGKAV